MSNAIFVFGSNLAGRHGKGAALVARQQYGASYGVGEGATGRAYAIPTKDGNLRSLHIDEVSRHVFNFKLHAQYHFGTYFQVTRIGCGLAGFKDEEVAPLFSRFPPNCAFDTKWKPWLGDEAQYWGTF